MKTHLNLLIKTTLLLLAVVFCGEVKAWEPDYNSTKNLWKYVDQIAPTDDYLDVAGQSEVEAENYPRGEAHHQNGSSTWTFKSNRDATATAAWQVYCHFYSGGIIIKNSSTYHFAMKVKADGDVTSFRWKAENRTESSARYVYEEVRSLKANEECLIKVTWHGTSDGSDLESLRLGLDLQGSNANTTLTVSEIYLEEVNDGSNYGAGCNVWRTLDAKDAGAPNYNTGVWGGDANMSMAHTAGSPDWTVTINNTVSQWLHLNYGGIVNDNMWHTFSVTITSDHDFTLRMKLENMWNSDNYSFDVDNIQIKAGVPYVFTKTFFNNAAGGDVLKACLSARLSDAPAGTKIKFSNIYLDNCMSYMEDIWQATDQKNASEACDDANMTHAAGSSDWVYNNTNAGAHWFHINNVGIVKDNQWHTFSTTITPTQDCKLRIKFENRSVNTTYSFDVQNIELKANQPYFFNRTFYNNAAGGDVENAGLAVLLDGIPAGTKLTFSNFKLTREVNGNVAMWDYDAPENLWKEVDQKSTYYTRVASNDKVAINHEPGSRHWDIDIKQVAGSWSSWINILSGIPIKHSSNYCFYAVICSDHDIPNAKLKLEKNHESGITVLNLSGLNVKAGIPYIVKENFCRTSGATDDFDDMVLSMDFEGAPAGTKACIHDIYFAEQEDWDVNSTKNIWPDATATYLLNKISNFTHDAAKKEWHGQINTTTTGGQWESSLQLYSDLQLEAGKVYDYFLTIIVDKDVKNGSIKLEDGSGVSNDLGWGTHDMTFKAYTPYVFKVACRSTRDGALTFTKARVAIGFDIAQAGTNFTIKDIYLAEHEEIDIANNDRKFYHVKAIAADGTDLGYLNRYLRAEGDSQRGYFNLYKDASGNTYLSSINGRMSFYVRGNTFKDPVTEKYFQRDDLDNALNSPIMQTYNALNGSTTGNHASVFPQLVPNTNEMDIGWSEKHFMEGDKEGAAGQVARRNCMLKLYKTSTANEYEVRFILRDNKVQNNIRPMAQDNQHRDMQSDFSGKGTNWEYPYYLNFAQGIPWNDEENTHSNVIYATTDYTKAARLVLEPADRPDIVLEHYVGYTYDTTAKEHPNGEIPEELLYGDDATDHDYYKRHDDDPRINADADPIQRTHELVKEVWVVPGESVELLPFSDFKTQTITQYHDSYVRWYDYATGKHPLRGDGTLDTDRLTGGTFFLRSQYGAFGGGELTGNRVNAASMLYKATAGRTEDVLDIMAVDVSQTYYNSSNVTKEENDTLYMKEPNIAFRVVFVIRNAAKRWEANDTYQKNLDYIKLHKEKLLAPEGTPFQYRLPFAEKNILDNSTYPTGYVYKDGSGNYQPIYHYLVETWDMVGGERHQLLGRTRVPDGTVETKFGDPDVSGKEKKDLAITAKPGDNTENRVLYIQDPKAGEYKIMVFALNNNGNIITLPSGHWLQLMEFDLTVLPKEKGNMILREELLTNDAYAHQRPEEMERLYGKPTMVVNFDDVKENTTTSTTNGYYMWPRKWEESSYAFGYDNRHDYNMYVVANHSSSTPYREAIDGSVNQTNPTKEYFDVLGTETNGAQQGYFYYTNAAGDPGRMTILNIGKDFCPRTTVYVSAWVKEFSFTGETANVVFSFKGIDTDGYETTLSSFATGYVTGGVRNTLPDGTNPDNRGLWHHVYYSFHSDNIPAGKKFDHFIISVENNCVNSGGADYAIDDIRAYIVKPAMQARQSVPLCNGEKQTKLILTTDFDNIMEAFSGTSGQIDYCFLDKEIYDEKMKTASTQEDYVEAFDAALIRDTYGSTTTYGVLNFKTTFDSNPKYDSTTNYDGVDLNQATRYQVGSVRQLVFPSYANDQKMLVGKDYIVAMVDHHAGTAPGALNFAVNDVCSATSEFTVITSGQVKIDGELASAQNGASVCANRIPKITIDMTGIGNLGEIQTTTASYFDWYYGKKMSTEYYKASPVLVEKKGTSEPETPCKPRFTWMTDSVGNVVITISEGEGTPGETYFRGGGMYHGDANGSFKLNGSEGLFDTYFTAGKKDDYTYMLTLKDASTKPADGSIISYQGMIECRSDKHINDWSTYAFAGYTYSIGEVECYDYAEYNGVRLDDAIFYFRHVYPMATEEDFKDLAKCPLKTVYLQEHRDCIMHFLNEKKLSLYKDSEFLSTYDKYQESRDPDTRKDFFITAIPINPTPDNDVLKYCLEPFQVTLTLSTRAPKMKNGDDSGRIPYPIDMRDVPLRIGLKQLQKVRMAGLSDEHPAHFLYMPLRDVEPATADVKSLIQKSDDDMVYLVASTDPNVKKGTSGAIPVELDPITNQPVTGAYQIIGKVSNIKAVLGTGHGNVCHLNFIEAFKFREGYQYTIKFKFEENYDVDTPGSHNDVCPGDVVCTLKVVPEYQMWTGAEDSNWNNDRNWRRVSSTELLDSPKPTAIWNNATAGISGYSNEAARNNSQYDAATGTCTVNVTADHSSPNDVALLLQPGKISVPGNYYGFAGTVQSDRDVENVKVYFELEGNNLLRTVTIPLLKAGVPYTFGESDILASLTANIYVHFDLGYAKAGTKVTISNLDITERSSDSYYKGLVTDEGGNDNASSFVPADFTKVIIPANVPNTPKLYNLRRGTPSGDIADPQTNLTSVHFAGTAANSNFIKNLEDQMTSSIGKATDLINFDMSSIDLTDGADNGNVACRAWYDHTCQYIHFNSEAQMLSQQFLNYEKAWADFEMEPNKWTTVSSPLINVVAGDLYLPTATARQETALFKDITFDTELHDRFNPAVFQRSWNASVAKVVHLNGDNTNSAIELDWSHVYNDGNVNYSAGVGFCIKPDVSMMPVASRPAKVLFRLPKADMQYDYWNPHHEETNHKTENVTAPMTDGQRSHRLADFTSTTFEQVVGQEGAPSTKYFLVGNPMMSYLNMSLFFDQNSTLERKYWIVTGKGQQYAAMDDKTEGFIGTVENTYVAPFTSFFVAMKEGADDEFTPTFTSSMMVVGEKDANGGTTYINERGVLSSLRPGDAQDPGNTRAVRESLLTIDATDADGNVSTAMLADGTEFHPLSIEALFDKNLYDRPMLYTNVDGEAMSLSQIAPGDTIPVALTGVTGNVELTLRGANDFGTQLYLLDTQNGEVQPINGDMTISQSANGVRYYILADPTGIDDARTGMPEVIVKDGVLTVKAPAGSELDYICIYKVDGATMAKQKNAGQEFSIQLPTNVYLIDAVCDGAKYTFKIAVR